MVEASADVDPGKNNSTVISPDENVLFLLMKPLMYVIEFFLATILKVHFNPISSSSGANLIAKESAVRTVVSLNPVPVDCSIPSGR